MKKLHSVRNGAVIALILLPVITGMAADKPATAEPIQIQPSAVDLPLPSGVDQTTGYRMNRYRGPVPDTNPGTEVVDTPRAYELYASSAVKFIDVYPPKGLGANPMDGTWMTNEIHQSVEGAIWLPEVGRGHLEPEHIEYFKRNLVKVTDNNKETPLIFFCTADCWQSWNAARRALLWGYQNIFWYPAGTDGWVEHNYPLVPVEPVNFLGD
jgi:PQQ-dependent catabolism-associated CXXCW motif protein